MARSPQVHPNSAAARARCAGDGCSKKGVGVILRRRVDERLRDQYALLCHRCAAAGGWSIPASSTSTSTLSLA